MVGVYLNNISISVFYEKLKLLEEHNIKTSELHFYSSDILENDNLVIRGNLAKLVEHLRTNIIQTIIFFYDDFTSEKDIEFIEQIKVFKNIKILIL